MKLDYRMRPRGGYEVRVRSNPDQVGGLLQESLCQIWDDEGPTDITISTVTAKGNGYEMLGENARFFVKALWTRSDQDNLYWDVTLDLAFKGQQAEDLGIRIPWQVLGTGTPRWMIPGAFYRHNRFAHTARKYPRYDFEGGDVLDLVSSHWSFRADRAALPSIFVWNDNGMGALICDETSLAGLNGIGFRGDRNGTWIWLDFPYREEPVVYDGEPLPQPADIATHRFQPNDQLGLAYRLTVGSENLHNYDPVLRAMYALNRQKDHLHPWMTLSEAAALTAHGLYTWHYHPEHDILYETAAFDRELNNNVRGLGDRAHMHVAWVSGAPYAYALLTYGVQQAHSEYTIAAVKVLNKIASGLSPSGFFWAEWTRERGWGSGWNPHLNWLQARTIAEAVLFMVRAIRFEKEQGREHPDWILAVKSNLDAVLALQGADGNFGSYYDSSTGLVQEWDGAGGILWIAALLEAYDLFNDARLIDSARRAGLYYRRFIDDEFIYGAPEDVHLTPTSEDAYNAVVAYVLLYEQDRKGPWLALARKASDWMMTFRWTYNLTFPAHTLLAQYDFRSRGADQASPSNQHLHNYGLFCVPEMLRLWEYTKDTYYLDRTRDLLACFLQFIAREDGDFNAYKGMVTERYYNTRCFQPKGMMVTLSHAWCVGIILYACQAAEKYQHLLDFND